MNKRFVLFALFFALCSISAKSGKAQVKRHKHHSRSSSFLETKSRVSQDGAFDPADDATVTAAEEAEFFPVRGAGAADADEEVDEEIDEVPQHVGRNRFRSLHSVSEMEGRDDAVEAEVEEVEEEQVNPFDGDDGITKDDGTDDAMNDESGIAPIPRNVRGTTLDSPFASLLEVNPRLNLDQPDKSFVDFPTTVNTKHIQEQEDEVDEDKPIDENDLADEEIALEVETHRLKQRLHRHKDHLSRLAHLRRVKNQRMQAHRHKMEAEAKNKIKPEKATDQISASAPIDASAPSSQTVAAPAAASSKSQTLKEIPNPFAALMARQDAAHGVAKYASDEPSTRTITIPSGPAKVRASNGEFVSVDDAHRLATSVEGNLPEGHFIAKEYVPDHMQHAGVVADAVHPEVSKLQSDPVSMCMMMQCSHPYTWCTSDPGCRTVLQCLEGDSEMTKCVEEFNTLPPDMQKVLNDLNECSEKNSCPDRAVSPAKIFDPSNPSPAPSASLSVTNPNLQPVRVVTSGQKLDPEPTPDPNTPPKYAAKVLEPGQEQATQPSNTAVASESSLKNPAKVFTADDLAAERLAEAQRLDAMAPVMKPAGIYDPKAEAEQAQEAASAQAANNVANRKEATILQKETVVTVENEKSISASMKPAVVLGDGGVDPEAQQDVLQAQAEDAQVSKNPTSPAVTITTTSQTTTATHTTALSSHGPVSPVAMSSHGPVSPVALNGPVKAARVLVPEAVVPPLPSFAEVDTQAQEMEQMQADEPQEEEVEEEQVQDEEEMEEEEEPVRAHRVSHRKKHRNHRRSRSHRRVVDEDEDDASLIERKITRHKSKKHHARASSSLLETGLATRLHSKLHTLHKSKAKAKHHKVHHRRHHRHQRQEDFE